MAWKRIERYFEEIWAATMIANVQLYLLWLLIATACYWLVASTRPQWRSAALIAPSMLFVVFIAPWAALIATYVAVSVWGWSRLLLRYRHSILSWVAVLSLLLPLLVLKKHAELSLIFTLGIGFLTLKSIASLIGAYHTRVAVPMKQVLLQIFFVPSYSAGPVEPISSFADNRLPETIDMEVVMNGLMRVALGLFKSIYLADVLLQGFMDKSWTLSDAAAEQAGMQLAFQTIVLNFAYTYVNFSAYMDIAIGSAALFNIKLMENFNYPFLARTLPDFWQRWHISLGQWVMKYLYFPMLVRFPNPVTPYFAMVFAFCLIGLWHEFTINYALWGLGHGLGIASFQLAKRLWGKKKIVVSFFSSPAGQFLGWTFTLAYVSTIQTIANLDNFDAVVRLLGAVIR